jgi:hypothetical protein
VRRLRPRFAAALLLAPAVLVLAGAGGGAAAQDVAEDPSVFPDGPHRDEVFYFCTACHSSRLVRNQALSRERWDDTLTWMSERHGMPELAAIEGTGDDVIIIDGEPDIAQISGNADGRYFGVIGYSNRSNLLVNTTDPYDGRVIVARDTILVEVEAVGSWSITFE